MNRRAQLLIAVIATTAVTGAAFAAAAVVKDSKRETNALRAKPELDIVRATSAKAAGDGRVKHKVTMRGKLKPGRKNTRPFILINTRGGKRSDFEYVVLGPRVFRVSADGSFVKAGANRFRSRKRTWVYRFPTSAIGSPASYGWAALTSKGDTTDLAPSNAYKLQRLG